MVEFLLFGCSTNALFPFSVEFVMMKAAGCRGARPTYRTNCTGSLTSFRCDSAKERISDFMDIQTVDYSRILSSRISTLRRETGLTQDALAEKLGVTFQAVSKWENALSCPDIALLPPIADVFGVSIDSLFGRTEEERQCHGDGEHSLGDAEPDLKSDDKAGTLPWGDDGMLHIAVFCGTELQAQAPETVKKIVFELNGEACSVSSQLSISCGDVCGNVTAQQDINCGDIEGDAIAGRQLTGGDVGGQVGAFVNGTVNCGDVQGDVSAAACVNCGDIEGDVQVGGSISCGDIGGNAEAGGIIRCGDVGGDISAGG